MFWVSPGFKEVSISRATPHVFGRSRPATGQTAGIIDADLTWYSSGQSPNVELVKMAVGPTESGLQDLMELSEVEFYRQFQTAADLGFDVDDVNFYRYHE